MIWTDKKIQQWKQTAFNRAWKGLESQGWERCVAEDTGECLWILRIQESDVTRCAVGWVLDDQLLEDRRRQDYADRVEGEHRAVWRSDLLPAELPKPEDPDQELALTRFLGELEEAHDKTRTPTRLRSEIRKVAAKHNLEVPKC